MDEFQGRLDTQGALVRKGAKTESSVAAALPLPGLVAAPVGGDKPDPRLVPAKQRTALLAELRKTLGAEDQNSCERFDENARDPAKCPPIAFPNPGFWYRWAVSWRPITAATLVG